MAVETRTPPNVYLQYVGFCMETRCTATGSGCVCTFWVEETFSQRDITLTDVASNINQSACCSTRI